MDKSFDIRLREGLAAIESGRPGPALERLESLEKEGFATPDLLEAIGRAWMMKGETEAAIRYFRRALQVNPNLLTSRIGLGLALIDIGETDEGVAILKKALDQGRFAGDLSPKARGRLVKEHVRIGEVYAELGFSIEAIREFEKAIRIGGDYPDIRRKMAAQYLRLNLLTDAERQLRRALQRNPFYEEARADLGHILMRRGRPDLAAEEWSQVELEGRGAGLVSAYRGELGPKSPGDEGEPEGRSIEPDGPRGGKTDQNETAAEREEWSWLADGFGIGTP